MTKLVINTLSIVLVVFLTIAGMTHYNRATTSNRLQQEYKLGYLIGCVENGSQLSVAECSMRADESTND